MRCVNKGPSPGDASQRAKLHCTARTVPPAATAAGYEPCQVAVFPAMLAAASDRDCIVRCRRVRAQSPGSYASGAML